MRVINTQSKHKRNIFNPFFFDPQTTDPSVNGCTDKTRVLHF